MKLISTGADDNDLLRFSEEILFEAKKNDDDHTLTFEDFCQGQTKDQIMKTCYFKF